MINVTHTMRVLFIILALIVTLSCVSAKFLNSTNHEITLRTQTPRGRIAHGLARITTYYFGTSVALNVAFRDEKRLAGIEAAKQLVCTIDSSIRPFVISYNIAVQKRRFFPGYYIITDVPTIIGAPASLDRSSFPYAQELFTGMCRPITAWQSFTVGQTIQPWYVGTNNFCHGQLIWKVGHHGRPLPIPLDDHDRVAIFHTWIWWKQIIKVKKYKPLIQAITSILFKSWIVSKDPRLLPLFLVSSDTYKNLSEKMKNVFNKKKETSAQS